ncbi:MAG: DNA repair protein RadA [Clostridiales bacterium]|jgi:DNA repair protein RadA/Sms|nr:DNA repair protein RadA [Clostridiales bacterium]
MAKAKTVFFCKECGYESSKWLGQCPGCKQWDTFVEEPVVKKSISASGYRNNTEPILLSSVKSETESRISSGIGELDRVLGGGIVPGSLVLVGGDPGIGKSTLLLQTCREIVNQGKKVIYITGEESKGQIKMRAERLGAFSGELLLLCETNLDLIEDVINKHKPEIVVIDSIQTMYKEDISSAPGSVSQVREATGALMHMAKGTGITIFIIGHVTKEGMVAGPRVLEHMVDTVLYFEGDNFASYRVLRAVKNRFGSTNEIGVFEMRSSGLAEVKNPSEYMLTGRPVGEPGSVVTASIEGTRPILVEIQALTSSTSFNMPRRTAAGTDYNRVNLLMAVLEKRLGIQLGDCDAYVNVAGGMRITEPALDLAIVSAILSSFRNKAINGNTIIFGEVGLTGEVRAVNMADQRVAEAAKMGFETCILPLANKGKIKAPEGIKLVGVKNIGEVLQYIKEYS